MNYEDCTFALYLDCHSTYADFDWRIKDLSSPLILYFGWKIVDFHNKAKVITTEKLVMV